MDEIQAAVYPGAQMILEFNFPPQPLALLFPMASFFSNSPYGGPQSTRFANLIASHSMFFISPVPTKLPEFKLIGLCWVTAYPPQSGVTVLMQTTWNKNGERDSPKENGDGFSKKQQAEATDDPCSWLLQLYFPDFMTD